jgi:hypothetical protein
MEAKNWMGRLLGDWKLSELNIPGTHDSGAVEGGPLFKCQTMSLGEQLASGIRFLDIRCRHKDNRFQVYHHYWDQDLSFGDVRQICTHYLDENPTECIVMLMKEEYDATGCNRSFEETFDWYRNGYEQYWYLGNKIPMLNQVRGKIVLLRRWQINESNKQKNLNAAETTEWGIATRGIDVSNWADDATFDINVIDADFRIQDGYKVQTVVESTDIKYKWERIEALLVEAEKRSRNIWYINYTSGSSGGAYPGDIAKGIRGSMTGMNTRLRDFLHDKKSSFPNSILRLGTIPMDFPEEPSELISSIFSYNRFSNDLYYVFPGGEGIIYAVDTAGNLIWYKHEGWREGKDDVGTRAKIGSLGWNNYLKIFSGGEGIIYAIDNAGDLIWYDHDTWRDGSTEAKDRKIVGKKGWKKFLSVFPGGQGVVYVIEEHGNLLWYKHLAWRSGGTDPSDWDAESAKIIGHGGWDGFRQVFSGGNGIIYAIDNEGKLRWYKHEKWLTGDDKPQPIGETKGNGWNEYRQVFSGGDNVIYAVDNAGRLLWYYLPLNEIDARGPIEVGGSGW